MPKRSNSFQRLVLRIHEALADSDTIVEESALVNGREIDILITKSISSYTIKIAIECRDHKRNQDVTWIDSLTGKYSDLGINKIIAVSSSPFSSAARDIAKKRDIEILTIQEASKTNWQVKLNIEAPYFITYKSNLKKSQLATLAGPLIEISHDPDAALSERDEFIKSFIEDFHESNKKGLVAKAKAKFIKKVGPSIPLGNSSFDFFISIPVSLRIRNIETNELIEAKEIRLVLEMRIESAIAPAKNFVFQESVASLADHKTSSGENLQVTLIRDNTGKLIGASAKVNDQAIDLAD